MAAKVPVPGWMCETENELATFLQETLDALLEFTGAAAGWVGMTDPAGALRFPARRGTFPEAWLTLQQGGGAGVWGFEVREGPTLLNELPALPVLGEPALANLLSCPLRHEGQPQGHLVLANKPNGFTTHDATVLQTTAHFLAKHMARAWRAPVSGLPAALLRLVLDCAGEGILVVDHEGDLLFANTTWERWTGYRAEELIGHPAPHPYWVSHRELAALGGSRPTLPGGPARRRQQGIGYLPFQHRNQSLFWCQVETCTEAVAGRPVTVAYLRRLPTTPPAVPEPAGGAVAFQALAEELPFAAALADGSGRLLWANRVFAEQLHPAAELLGQTFLSLFTPASAAGLERLIRDPGAAGPDGRGHLLLQRPTGAGDVQDLMTYWQALHLPQGRGFLFAFAEDWESLWFGDAAALPASGPLRPGTDCLVLLFRPGAPIEFWDERWERLTGLAPGDLAGVSGELVLDWLFAQQRDRDFVADLLQQPARRDVQAVLEVAGRHGGHSLLCTFLPVHGGGLPGTEGTPAAGEAAWLILAGAPQLPACEDASVQRFLRQFTRGLSHLLNNYLTVPVGLAEMALDRSDLPADLATSFSQILESCMRAGRLIAALQDLAAEPPNERQHLSLAAFVRDFLEEQAAEGPAPTYELRVQTDDSDALVEVNPRMLKVVLRHLLSNAAQALLYHDRRRIQVRVFAGETDVRCEIQDTGAGLPTADWTAVFAPFYSTKGPFAREASQAAVDALGLGLTVSQHLLALHGGRLELRSVAGEGTTAVLILPRRGGLAGVTGREPVRADRPAEVSGPHAKKAEDSGVREAGS